MKGCGVGSTSANSLAWPTFPAVFCILVEVMVAQIVCQSSMGFAYAKRWAGGGAEKEGALSVFFTAMPYGVPCCEKKASKYIWLCVICFLGMMLAWWCGAKVFLKLQHQKGFKMKKSAVALLVASAFAAPAAYANAFVNGGFEAGDLSGWTGGGGSWFGGGGYAYPQPVRYVPRGYRAY